MILNLCLLVHLWHFADALLTRQGPRILKDTGRCDGDGTVHSYMLGLCSWLVLDVRHQPSQLIWEAAAVGPAY